MNTTQMKEKVLDLNYGHQFFMNNDPRDRVQNLIHLYREIDDFRGTQYEYRFENNNPSTSTKLTNDLYYQYCEHELISLLSELAPDELYFGPNPFEPLSYGFYLDINHIPSSISKEDYSMPGDETDTIRDTIPPDYI